MICLDGSAIVYREEQPHPALRAFIVFIGLGVGLMIPLPYLMHADWGTPSWTLVLAALCVVVPAVLGAFFVRIGLVSATALRIVPAEDAVLRERRGVFRRRSDRFALSSLPPPELLMRDSESDGLYPVLRLRLPGQRLEIACFRDRGEAEYWRDLIRELIRPGATAMSEAGRRLP